MTTATVTLTDFLLARIAGDEAVARAALSDGSEQKDDGRWSVSDSWGHDDCLIEGIGITIYDEGGHDAAQAAHIARWDPARVLAECEAKRRIVEVHEPMLIDAPTFADQTFAVVTCSLCDDAHPCRTLRHLAAVYADHPDWREEWRA